MNTQNLEEKLLESINCNDILAIKNLLSDGMPPEIQKSMGKNILETALKTEDFFQNHEEIIQYLIEQGIDTRYVASFGFTYLHIAAISNIFSIVQSLLDLGLDPAARTFLGYTAIFYADSPEMVELFIKNKSGSFQDVDENQNTLLHHAIAYVPNYEITCFFIKHIDVNSKNNEDETPLIKLLLSKNFPDKRIEIIDLLLSHGADINLAGNYGQSPFSTALRVQETEIAVLEKLIQSGADIHQLDEGGGHAIHYAAAMDLDYLKFMLKQKVDINTLTIEKQQTPLMIAAMYNQQDTVEYLLDQGADINLRDTNGKTAMDFAQDKELPGITALLKEKEG